MTRKRHFDHTAAEHNVDTVMRWGYYVVEFSPHHVRIQDVVDFWPGTVKWRCAKGYKFDRDGVGLVDLKAYLTEYFPLEEMAE